MLLMVLNNDVRSIVPEKKYSNTWFPRTVMTTKLYIKANEQNKSFWYKRCQRSY